MTNAIPLYPSLHFLVVLAALAGELWADSVKPVYAGPLACDLAAPKIPGDGKSFEDFEIVVDPEDPEFNLIFVANTPNDLSDQSEILVARLNGRTGILSREPRIITKNFVGLTRINGPELAYSESNGLGVLYTGPEGVHAAWRPPGAPWYSFSVDVYGLPFARDLAPALPGTAPGRHPAGSPDFGMSFYAEVAGAEEWRCEEHCYGHFTDPARTDLGSVLRASFNLELIISTPHPGESGYILFNACNSNFSNCGLFEVEIDGLGGINPSTLLRLTPVSQSVVYSPRRVLRAGIHPVTGSLVVFGIRGTTLDAWESVHSHEPFTSIQTIDDLPADSGNVRTVPSDSALYFYFIVFEGAQQGAYVVEYADRLAGPRKLLPKGPGTELVYLPGSDRLAIYFSPRVVDGGQLLIRCWVD